MSLSKPTNKFFINFSNDVQTTSPLGTVDDELFPFNKVNVNVLIAHYGDGHMRPELFEPFAKFEKRQKEYERTRAIYKCAIDKIGKS